MSSKLVHTFVNTFHLKCIHDNELIDANNIIIVLKQVIYSNANMLGSFSLCYLRPMVWMGCSVALFRTLQLELHAV